MTRNLTRPLLNLLFPQTCLLCGGSTNQALAVCPACEPDLPFNNWACGRCAEPLKGGHFTSSSINVTNPDLLCGHCSHSPPPFTHSFSPFRYEFPIAELISRFKYKHHLGAGELLANLLCSKLIGAAPVWLAAPTTPILTPVPMHWQRQLQRGFNQAEFIASMLAKQLNLPYQLLCQRTESSAAQRQLKRKDRLKNLRHKFAVTQPVANKHIVLVDDVMTTGATLFELSRVLRNAGAVQVDTITLARTP